MTGAPVTVKVADGLVTDPAELVTVTVALEVEQPPRKVMTLEEIFSARRPPFRSGKEIDESIQRQRDEWDY